MEQRCRDYISMQISKIIQIIQNTTETLDVSVSFSLKKRFRLNTWSMQRFLRYFFGLEEKTSINCRKNKAKKSQRSIR